MFGKKNRKDSKKDKSKGLAKGAGTENLEEIKSQEAGISGKALEQVQPNEKEGKAKKVKRVKNLSTWEFFLDNILNKATRGELDNQENEFEITYSRIMSANSKKRVIFIKEFPERILPGHLEALRNSILNSISVDKRPKVKINIISHNLPYHLNVINNKKLESPKRNFINQAKELETDIVRDTAAEITGKRRFNAYKDSIIGKQIRLARINRKVNSFDEMKRIKINGGQIIKSYVFLECCGETIELCDYITDMATKKLESEKYIYKDVTELRDYVKKFGLAELDFSGKLNMSIYPTTYSTEISAADITYSEGIVRSAQGDIYIMTSLDTRYPVFISLSESAGASNMMILGESGSGKTLLVKSFILNALNHKNNTYNFIIDDIKGDEYNFDKYIKKCQVISMGISNPVFINTIDIPNYKTFKFETPESAYDMCFGFTVKLLSTLASTTEGMERDKINNLCTDIVDKLYLTAGVDRRLPTSYKNSKNINFREDLWDAIVTTTTASKTMDSRHSKAVLQHVRASLEPYFMDRGSKSYMFSNSININELMEMKVLIFDYGTQSAGGQGVLLEKEIQSRLLMRNFFTRLYAAKNKLKDEYTTVIAEEVQRQLNNPDLARELNDMVTGGRSSNMSTIILTNTIEGILSSDDINISAIKENIKTLIMGKVKPHVASQTIKFFNLEQAEDRVGPVLSSVGKFENSFLLAFNTGKSFDMTVGKVTLPKQMLEHDIFKSRTIESIRDDSSL